MEIDGDVYSVLGLYYGLVLFGITTKWHSCLTCVPTDFGDEIPLLIAFILTIGNRFV